MNKDAQNLEPTYAFSNGEGLLELCKIHQCNISEIMIRREMYLSECSREAVLAEMKLNLDVMREGVTMGLDEPQSSVSGFTVGDAIKLKRFRKRSYLGENVCDMVAAALSVVEVNSAMGKIVSAPTAGASGVIPGCLITAAGQYNISDEKLIEALFCTAAVGMIIAENATISGAEGGCQAEVGSASAMTAAALCEMRSALPKTCLNAAAIALKNILGLVCDPVAGLVECPCIKRNAMGSVNAVVAADMSLAGINSLIPFDEVVSAMKSVGRLMHVDLKETAKGGLAATKTGKELLRKIREALPES
ncbi:MAG: L-serine ammonia-lyase, iron-sulfur-dependent, subunit alpha [Clostridiales bacterium]|nr:L-serine ammonia-lyase, iron-sulfur-dependent, subunit alpha [Clostridiales bacterium]